MYKQYFKRPMDFVLSLMAIIVLSPILIIVGVLVRVKLGSPVLFKQKRPGLNEKIFTMYKFRTMTDEKDENGELLPDSVRLTKFGMMLRSTSLDELPELFNILKGDMSIVGPRPLAAIYLPYYNESERHRHDVRPGLTGLAQVNGRNALNWPDRFTLDIRYVYSVSLLLDTKIILKTVGKVLGGKDIALRGTSQIIDFHKFRMSELNKKIEIQSKDGKTSIRSIRNSDAATLMEMNNDTQIAKFVIGTPKKVTLEEQRLWMDSIKNEKSTIRFMVDYKEKPVGTIIISNISENNLSANMNIKLLETARGKGIGTESIRLALKYCFEEMNLWCITAHVLSYNKNSLALFKKTGFTNEGVLRSRVIKDGNRYDLVSFSILKSDYEKGMES